MIGLPGPDEKVCPFCAEIVKKAAVKCRFCHSDLPMDPVVPTDPLLDVTGHAFEPDEPDLPDENPDDDVDDSSGATRRIDLVAIALGVVCLVLAGVLTTIVLVSRPGDLQVASNGQVTDPKFRDEAMDAAARNAVLVGSLSYKTLQADEDAARAVMSAESVKEYDDAVTQIATSVTANRYTVKATPVAVSVISLRRYQARIMMWINTVTTVEGSTSQQLDQNRIVLTMTRTDGRWIVSKTDKL